MSKRPKDEEPLEEEPVEDIFAQTDLDISTAVPVGPIECLGMTFSSKPSSRLQKYRLTPKDKLSSPPSERKRPHDFPFSPPNSFK